MTVVKGVVKAKDNRELSIRVDQPYVCAVFKSSDITILYATIAAKDPTSMYIAIVSDTIPDHIRNELEENGYSINRKH